MCRLKNGKRNLKKSRSILCGTQSERVEFAVSNLQEYPTGKVCRLLDIAKSSYYYHCRHPYLKSYNAQETVAVYELFMAHHGSFGRRTLKRLLERKGISLSERKIGKILKNLELRPKYGRRKGKNVYTSPHTQRYLQDNLYQKLTEEERRNEIWSMDFTEVRIKGVKIYTCGIISVNRKILVGYTQSSKCTAELAKETFKKAVSEYGIPYMVMTDRGSQFTSKAFYDTMQEYQVNHSMSRPHKPIDNCFIETFWNTMKTEIGKTTLLDKATYAMVTEYYMAYYNNERPHSALNYFAPLDPAVLRDPA